MPGVNLEQAHFHEVVDDDAAVFMTDLVKGYGDIYVFVEHLVNEPVKLPMKDLEPLAVRPPDSEPERVNALEVFDGDQQMKMWFIVLAVTMSFRVITFMSMLSMKRIMIMRMMMESTKLIFQNLEAMIMLKQIMLTMVSCMIMLMKGIDPIFQNLEAMIMLKLLMLTMVSHIR